MLLELPVEILWGTLIALLFCSAFFSASETSMISLNHYRLKTLKQENALGAHAASALLERKERLLGLILFGNNLVNLAASAIATVLALQLFGDPGIIISTVALTCVILIFAEITPKTIAALHPERVALPFSLLLKPLMTLLLPVVWILDKITSNILRLMGVDIRKQTAHKLGIDALRSIVDDSHQELSETQRSMLRNILNLEKVSVQDVMTPRAEIIGVNLNQTEEAIFKQLETIQATHIPVYRDEINKIIGILYLGHFPHFAREGRLDKNALENCLKEPYFIPEQAPLFAQIEIFKRLNQRLGIIVDEYGTIQGLISLSDILSEIAGEFTAYQTHREQDIFPQHDGSYLISGSISIHDINKSLSWKLPERGYKTLNGLIIHHLGDFPTTPIGMRVQNYRIEVVSLKGHLIDMARVHPPDEAVTP